MSVVMKPLITLEQEEQSYLTTGEALEAIVGRLMTIHHGGERGYYALLANHGPMSAPELAVLANSSEAAARDWLETQVLLGVLAGEDHPYSEGGRRYCLPEHRAALLLRLDDPFSSIDAAGMAAA
jgi:hypothetical protein